MDDRKRFLIFTQGRTGSTLLCSLLDSHPGIRCQLEILSDPVDDVPALLDRRSRGVHPLTYGFKVKTQQLEGVQRLNAAAFLQIVDADGWQIIHQRRRNIFRIALSNIVLTARKTQQKGAWSRQAADYIAPIYIDPPDLLRGIEFRKNNDATESAALAGLPFHSIDYDDLRTEATRPAAVNAVFQFLGLPDHDATTPFHKVTPPDWRDSVTNPDEIAAALAGTPFERMAD